MKMFNMKKFAKTIQLHTGVKQDTVREIAACAILEIAQLPDRERERLFKRYAD